MNLRVEAVRGRAVEVPHEEPQRVPRVLGDLRVQERHVGVLDPRVGRLRGLFLPHLGDQHRVPALGEPGGQRRDAGARPDDD
ncbi:hypothetical protein C1280_29415 [Gemmata obscuriglobus]|uniref:Uncharacterized protein n=2 Tax=Gemmata obscuriglobus TaxID=114 RepID=A0A2Z3H1Q4_9BACT|nr:hypothetical protein C1280_29415 [Gemmata obscuriglobus]